MVFLWFWQIGSFLSSKVREKSKSYKNHKTHCVLWFLYDLRPSLTIWILYRKNTVAPELQVLFMGKNTLSTKV